jgi:hypothetical protein
VPVCDIPGRHRPAADQSETDTALIVAGSSSAGQVRGKPGACAAAGAEIG